MPPGTGAPKKSIPAPPDGFRWALIPEDPEAQSQRRVDLPTFADSPLREFRYDKLSHISKRIRLLTLMAGDHTTLEVECQLFEGEIGEGKVCRLEGGVRTEQAIEYEALSWSWGRSPPDYQVIIRRGELRWQKRASEDLVWALRYLRYPDKDRVLWIDALCIDQASVEEKNHQVQMMSQIYSYAVSVCVWLGLNNRESRMAISFIKEEILKLEQFDELCQDERNSEKWQSLLLLMQREWFFRRWVVQEIALARKAVIYCGPDVISWEDFSVAVELFVEVETATHRLSEVMKKDPQFYHVPGWFEYVSALGASLLVEATGMIFRYYKPDKSKLPPTEAPHGGQSARSPTRGPAKPRKKKKKKGPRDESTSETDADSEKKRKENESLWADMVEDDTEPEDDKITNPQGRGRARDGIEDTGEQDEKVAGDVKRVDGAGDPGSATQPGSELSKNAASTAIDHTSPGTAAHGSGGNKDEDSAAVQDPISQRRPLLSLEYLVSKMSIFEATEPRDAIYALLAIANDGYPAAEGPDEADATQTLLREVLTGGDQKPFPVNYGRAYADVCQDFIEFCIARSDKSRALDIICRPWAPEPSPGISIHYYKRPKTDDMKAWAVKAMEARNDLRQKRRLKKPRPPEPLWKSHFPLPKKDSQQSAGRRDEDRRADEADLSLPSWIPRLEGAPYAMHKQAGIHIMKMGRKNADPLVGDPNSRNYDAAQGTPVDTKALRFRKRRRQGAHCMFVKGFVLEVVKETEHSSQSGNIPEEWLRMAEWDILEDPDEDEGPPDEFWRTIVADRGRESRNPPYYYKKACKESVYKGGLASGTVNTSDLINNERNSIVAQFCRRVQAVIWNRSLIKTEKGNLGVAGKTVKPGDLVCILYGCSVPVILRKHPKSQEEKNEDEEEDARMQKVEATLCHAMARYKPRRRREKAYDARPETLPEHRTPKEKAQNWSKKEVKEWLKDYKARKKAEQAEQAEKKRLQLQVPPTPATPGAEAKKHVPVRLDPTRGPRVPKDYYYEFLGECYLHGMMDGEAMSRKTDFDEKKAKEWMHVSKTQEQKKKIAEKLKYYQEKRKEMQKRRDKDAENEEINFAVREEVMERKKQLQKDQARFARHQAGLSTASNTAPTSEDEGGAETSKRRGPHLQRASTGLGLSLKPRSPTLFKLQGKGSRATTLESSNTVTGTDVGSPFPERRDSEAETIQGNPAMQLEKSVTFPDESGGGAEEKQQPTTTTTAAAAAAATAGDTSFPELDEERSDDDTERGGEDEGGDEDDEANYSNGGKGKDKGKGKETYAAGGDEVEGGDEDEGEAGEGALTAEAKKAMEDQEAAEDNNLAEADVWDAWRGELLYDTIFELR